MITKYNEYIKEAKMYGKYVLIPLTPDDFKNLKEGDKLYIDKSNDIIRYTDNTCAVANEMVEMFGKVNIVNNTNNIMSANSREFLDVIYFYYDKDNDPNNVYYFPASICYKLVICPAEMYKPRKKVN